MTCYLGYLLIMELRFYMIVYSKLGIENSDSGHIKCSSGPKVTNPCATASIMLLADHFPISFLLLHLRTIVK